MSYLFSSPPPSYAEEQLSTHLSSISTLPISLSSTQSHSQSYTSSSPRLNPVLQEALVDLSVSRPLTRQRVIEVLRTLVGEKDQHVAVYSTEAEVDRAVEAEVLGRAVTMVWKEVLQVLMDGALELEEERGWWDGSLNSRRGVGIYLVQTLPHRLYRAIPPHSTFSLHNLPTRSTIFKPISSSPTAALNSLLSPFTLTRREMLASRKALTRTRDDIARKIGLLASQGPRWSEHGDSTSVHSSSDLPSETSRIYSLLCQILDVPPPPSPTPKRSRSSAVAPSPTSALHSINPAGLLAVLEKYLPQSRSKIDSTLSEHRRPGPLTRLWFPLLFLPPALYTSASVLSRNREWMRAQILNARETARGFIVQWVWEPLEGIGKTLRGGGEGLGVAPTTVKSDQASLERMVLDLGRDYYHFTGPQLEALGAKVQAGDMEEVLRVYEKEMQSPLKNALLGSLIRTLLIQVQKTKTDLSLSLLSLDHLLRSQQLTFAFVGVAPSVLILYGIAGWLRGALRGEKRGKGRRRQYFSGLRDVERLLITAPKGREEMLDRDRGLLIVSVSGMRAWAAGLGGSNREAFLEDLRLVEDPSLTRGDKLRIVERIWRCWGVFGKPSL